MPFDADADTVLTLALENEAQGVSRDAKGKDVFGPLLDSWFHLGLDSEVLK